MKFQILRRAGALVLALVLALTLTVPAWADDEDTVPVTGVTLNKKALSLTVGGSETLTATVEPAEATDKTVTWSSDKPAVATVDGGKVTAVAVGSANITVTTTDGSETDTCVVTVTAAPTTVLTLEGKDPLITDPGDLILTAKLTNAPADAEISWSIQPKADSAKAPTTPPDYTFRETWDGSTLTSVATFTSTNANAGDYIVTVTDGKQTATKNVTISGLVLSATTLEMHVNENAALTVDIYGDAASRDLPAIQWESSSPSTVSVMPNAGSLSAWQLGKGVEITASKGKYWATCVVDVVEDESVIAGPYTASVSDPLKFMDKDPKLDVGLYNELDGISIEKTGVGLKYITNLKVSPKLGTLYYNYVSEGDTGNGVGTGDAFSDKASGSIKSLDRLYFVPKQGVTGTVDITFNGVSEKGNFSGIIRVTVGSGTDADGNENRYQISYRTQAGEPAWFLTDDFNTFCKSATGRGFNSVTFSLPQPSQGTLYYNYMAGTGNPVSTTTKFTPSGVYTLDNVCFVPNSAFIGKVTISFRAEDTSGEVTSGEVIVNVAASASSNDPTNVYISGERGKPVELETALFNDACQQTIHDTLDYVTFKLPDPGEGTLYYNYRSESSYDSRVTAITRYYYSGVPSISGVAFVPASNATGRIAIPYIGYSSSGTSFTGTLYISMDETDYTTIRYFVPKNSSVSFSVSDFNTAGLYEKGVSVDFVTFEVPDTKLGTLYYNYRGSGYSNQQVSSRTGYVLSPKNSWDMQLSLISFRTESLAGTVTIPYTAYCGTGSSQQKFEGNVVIRVGALTPEDVSVSCNTSGQARLSYSALSNVCYQAMGESLSYIEITSIPDPEEGHLYLNYHGFGTGTAVKKGNRFYCTGSPNISQLCFVPRAGFTGEAVITYIGCSYINDEQEQEQVSGRIVVKVTASKTSRFTDMGRHTWAIDAVEYLYQNGTVKGVGGSLYAPTGSITKGDFTLMLVRAYGLTASGSASFKDVPADSYYADAIRIAALLGIAGGSNGNYRPKTALSRQDAMLMIYNALKASGRTTTNGLAADLSAYYDEGQIASYAREAMGSLVQMGVVKGDGNGYLWPRSLLNRAEAAVLLHTIMTL